MNIIKFELKRNLRSSLTWGIIVLFAGILYSAMGPAFLNQSDTLIAFLEGMGDEFLTGFGINLDTFFTPVGFYSYVGGYISIALCVQAMMYGMNAFVLEKNRHSIEFLYTKPIGRTKVFISKYVANIILLFITQVIVISGIYIVTDIINSGDYDHMLMLMLLITVIPLQLLFFTLGSVVGVSVDKLKSIVSIALGASIGMYVINMLGQITDNSVFEYLSFFNYFNLGEITLNESYDMAFVILTSVLIIVFTTIALIVFSKKDLKVL